MPSFTLVLGASPPDNCEQIHFDAASPEDALHFLEREGISGKAVLWQDGKRLAALSLCEAGFWQLEP